MTFSPRKPVYFHYQKYNKGRAGLLGHAAVLYLKVPCCRCGQRRLKRKALETLFYFQNHLKERY